MKKIWMGFPIQIQEKAAQKTNLNKQGYNVNINKENNYHDKNLHLLLS